MTEQERIEEIKNVIPYLCCNQDGKYTADAYRNAIANAIYDAGYRKAKEIFAKCKEKCMFEGYPYGIDYTELVEVFKEFGVEVDE